jgi:guanine nucleotide-binding protein subunit alpha
MVRGWKDALERSGIPRGGLSKRTAYSKEGVVESDDATDVIASCREDMKALWADPVVHALLGKRRRRLEHSAGLYVVFTLGIYMSWWLIDGSSFLNDLDRIATREYVPSDQDVLRARLRTLGVQEYRLQFEHRAPQFLSMGTIYSISFSSCLQAVE